MRFLKQVFFSLSLVGIIGSYSAFNFSDSQNEVFADLKNSFTQKNIQQDLQLQPQETAQKKAFHVEGALDQGVSETPPPEAFRYVRINGRYFRQTHNHIYNVGGERIYFRDDTHFYDQDGKRHQVAKKQHIEDGQLRVVKPTALGQVYGQRDAKIGYSPSSVKDMMQGLKEAQENMKERAKALNELAK